MGEKQNEPFQLGFNRFLKVDLQGSRVTSDGGLILVRELDGKIVVSSAGEAYDVRARGPIRKFR